LGLTALFLTADLRICLAEDGVADDKSSASESHTLPEVVVSDQAPQEENDNGYVAHRASTATKTDTPLIETPQSISVVTREQLDLFNVQRVEESLRYAPGASADALGADNRFDGGNVVVRGFFADQYLDGMKVPIGSFSFAQIDTNFLERVELLYGPSSVLYGSAGPGGIINLVSKRPTEEAIHEIGFETGSYGLTQETVDLSGPLDEGKHFLYRLNFLGRNTGTQVDYTEYARYSIAPAFTWRPDDQTSLTLLSNFDRDPEAGFYNQLPLPGTVLPNPNGKVPTDLFVGDPDFSNSRRYQEWVGYAFEHQFNDWLTAKQNFRYFHSARNESGVYPFDFEPDLRNMIRDSYEFLQRLNGVTLDNQLQAKFRTAEVEHTVLGGVDYQRLTNHGRYLDDPAPDLDYLDPVYEPITPPTTVFTDEEQTQYQIGYYAQEQAKWQGWGLTVGGRYDQSKSKTQDNLSATYDEQTDYKFTTRDALNYVFDNGIAPYFSYSESFEPVAGTDFSGKAFTPTTGQQEELGIKYQPKAFEGFFRVAVYNLTQQNVLTDDPANSQFQVQTGEIRSRGIELEGHVSPVEGWNLISSYGYIDNEITDSNAGDEGKRSIYAGPARNASLWSNYTFQVAPLTGFGIGLGSRYIGSAFADTANTTKIPDVFVWDSVVNYDFGAADSRLNGLRLAVNGSNIFDKEYVSFASDFGAYYGLRRSIIASLSYRW
jgi:iron complex outermembrane receptor protein